ncbi:MAG: hypothetical protein ACFFBW_15040, partial [Promethearchaeota archaeon]
MEVSFKKIQKKTENNLLSGFFNDINHVIKNIQDLISKEKNLNDLTRIFEYEDSTLVISYHPQSKILFCSISDADDDTDQIKMALHKIGIRFWKKHHSDLKLFRETTEKNRFHTFIVDV